MATFDAATHTYTICDQIAPKSVTALVKTQFPFNSAQIIAANYHKWKAANNAKYVEHYDKPDDEAKTAIQDDWTQRGKVAAKHGTAVHAWAEEFINLKLKWCCPTLLPLPEYAAENNQVLDFVAFLEKYGFKGTPAVPYAAELIVWWKTKKEIVTLAGTIDAVFKDDTQYYIVDWKRTHQPIEGDRFKQYSLQLSIYSLLLKQSRNIDAQDNMFLVRLNPNSTTYEKTKCIDLRAWARLLLDA